MSDRAITVSRSPCRTTNWLRSTLTTRSGEDGSASTSPATSPAAGGAPRSKLARALRSETALSRLKKTMAVRMSTSGTRLSGACARENSLRRAWNRERASGMESPWDGRVIGPQAPCHLRGAEDADRFDVVELWELSLQVAVPISRHTPLIGRLPISGVDRVDDTHSFDHSAKRRESHRVEPRVVGKVDEELIAPRVWSTRGEDQGSTLVALDDRVVGDRSLFPLPVHGRITVHSELRDEPRHDTDEANVPEITG